MTQSASPVDRTIASVLWLLIGRWSQFALSLVTLTVMARFLGPEVYGLYALCYVAVGLGDALVNGAFAEALIPRRALERHHENAAFAMSLMPAVALAAAMILGGRALADLFDSSELAVVLPAMSGVVVLAAIGAVPAALLEREMHHRKLVMIDNSAGMIASLTGIGLAIGGFGVWSLVAMETIRVFVRSTVLMRVARWVPGFTTSRSAIADIWTFGRKVVAIRLLQYVDRMTPVTVLGLVLGETAVGYYSLGWRIYEQIQRVLVAPMANVAMPAAALAQDDLPTLRAILEGATRATSSIAYPAFIGAAAIAPVAVPFLFGSQWGPAVPAVQILLLIGIRSAISAFNGGVMRGLGRPDLQLGMLAVGATATLLMVPIAAPYGIAAGRRCNPGAQPFDVAYWRCPYSAIDRATGLDAGARGGRGAHRGVCHGGLHPRPSATLCLDAVGDDLSLGVGGRSRLFRLLRRPGARHSQRSSPRKQSICSRRSAPGQINPSRIGAQTVMLQSKSL